MTKLLSKLTKSEILSLPGFNKSKSCKLTELKNILKDEITRLGLKRRGLRINDYIERYNEEQKQADNALFNRIHKMKKSMKQLNKLRDEYKQELIKVASFNRLADSIIAKVLYERSQSNIDSFEQSFMNMESMYSSNKTLECKRFESNVTDINKYEQEMKRMMIAVKKHESFEIDINDDNEKQYAFTQVLRYVRSMNMNEYKPMVYGFDMNGKCKVFNLNRESNIDDMINCIMGEITVEQFGSDSDPNLIGWDYIPIRFEAKFIRARKDGNKTDFVEKVNDDVVVIESVDAYRNNATGAFFPYINLIESLDLSRYQIYHSIDPLNYKDNCFVYACIQSSVFDDDELHSLRSMMKTRSIPNKKILDIAIQMQCHFIVYKFDDKRESRHQRQLSIDTRKNKKVVADRQIQLLLFKDHYMIDNNEMLPIATYYIEHKDELDKRFSYMDESERQMIKNDKGDIDQKGSSLTLVLRTMFEQNQFREIRQCEQGVLNTCEFDNHLNDYVDLAYDDKLCCKEEGADKKKQTKWSHVYYADYETDVTVSPHKPYLCCVCDDKIVKSFTGSNLTAKFLNSLKSNSLTYFHNLKYDACFFISEPGWDVKITQRSGTLLQVVMDKKIDKDNKIHLIFRNSYSIIPAPLRDFNNMFNLNVHKEIIAYKIYNATNIKRQFIPFNEFYEQYRIENMDRKDDDELETDRKQLLINAKQSGSYNDKDDVIDIIKYAKFYCIKDCLTLMNGMNRFNDDLSQIFKQAGKEWIGIHQFISISAVGYDFARIYGCFDGCYQLSGKPQNFIQRTVSGGRTMTANNEKQYIEGKIQDFDAVSLYPSAMSKMNGIAKGMPKVIPINCTHEQLMSYDAFFIEINITKLQCKSNNEYRFGHIFKYNDVGSKVFCNKTVDHYYVDKVTLMDLIEFYDIEYELIRGYYFNDGFNNKINAFIKTLFDLRLKYKNEHNPSLK